MTRILTLTLGLGMAFALSLPTDQDDCELSRSGYIIASS